MVVRAIWPLAVYYPGSDGFADLVTAVRSVDEGDLSVAAAAAAAAAEHGSDRSNLLAIDALEYSDISRAGGKTRRMCMRTSLFVPWTPVLYAAVHPEHASDLRRRLNLRLMIAHGSPVYMTVVENVRSLIRTSDRVLWSLEDMTLCELRFDSYASRSVALRYLKDNAHAHAHQYSLFASNDSTCFEVALASYFRQRLHRRRNQHDSSMDDDDDDDDDDDEKDDDDDERRGGDNGGRGRQQRHEGIDLRKVFEMGVWCRVNERSDTIIDQYIEKMNESEIRRNQLPADPLLLIPVVSYDIETIARMDSTLPQGVEEDQRLSSIAITVHHRQKQRSAAAVAAAVVVTTVPIYLAYAPLAAGTMEELESRELRVQQSLRALDGMRRATIRFYRDECELLRDALKILSDNEFFVDLYRLDDPADATRMASLLIGYNSWEYDYMFLARRAIYYGLYEDAFRILAFHREPRFNAAQLSLDLMKHVRARYAAQLGSFALKYVSRYFGANEEAERGSLTSDRSKREKMNFDAVAIRRMYFRGDGGDEIFDSKMAFDNMDIDHGVNMLRVSLYNLQDCTTVYYLMSNLALLPTLALYSRHFYATLWESSHSGNSRLLPNAFVVRSLLSGKVILPFRRNEYSLLTMPPPSPISTTTNGGGGGRKTIAPCSPSELANLCDDPTRRLHDQVSVMRIDETKLYIGGINSATSAHYVRPICLDFTSFYPSIGCQYELSMETVHIVTCDHLLALHDNDETLLDRTIAAGVIRCFDYEPVNSPHRRREAVLPRRREEGDDEYLLRGRDALANAVIRHNDGWYEGVEFTRAREIVDSSEDPSRRRVLVICRTASSSDGEPPIICSLWRHYLRMRQRYKVQLHTADDVYQRRVLNCKEKMFKVVANSIYGYLNYTRSVVYSPQVAAAVTLLSRKTFHETSWICEVGLPTAAIASSIIGRDEEDHHRHYLTDEERATLKIIDGGCDSGDGDDDERRLDATSRERIECEVVYRDTDGLILFVSSAATGRSVSMEQQGEFERLLLRLINGTFARYDCNDITIALEDSSVETCCIMGKKKYWKTLSLENDRFVTKGFEKNAQEFVKHIVSVLQRNVSAIVSACNLARCRLVIADLCEFIDALYTALNNYYDEHGPDVFSFNLALNPRCVAGAEADFIQRTIERYNYNPGDRVRCVFVLDTMDPAAVKFCLLRDFRPTVDRLNYFKIIRRLVTYLVQLVEGFKRGGGGGANDDHHADNTMAATKGSFDRNLCDAYTRWLSNSNRGGGNDRDSNPMDALFRANNSTDWSEWLLSSRLRAVDLRTTTTTTTAAV